MKKTTRTAISTFLAALALTATAMGLLLLPAAAPESPDQLVQSTSAILEGRAA